MLSPKRPLTSPPTPAADAETLTPERRDGFLPISDYAAIGDGHAVALVGADGAVDWLCLPDLDSPPVFGALLDPASGGSFTLAPAVPYTVARQYLEGTNVLETTFSTAEGVVRVTDCFNRRPGQLMPWREFVRVITGESGTVPMRWSFAPSPSLATEAAGIEPVQDGILVRGRRRQLSLRSWGAGTIVEQRGPERQDVELAVAGGFTASAGERAMLAMTASTEQAIALPSRSAMLRRLEGTPAIWRAWLGSHNYRGPWREAVERSLLALGLLCDGRTGALAAAATSSLPEVLGGKRNYDYRFAWVRDASFALDAFLGVGMEEVAHPSLCWLLSAVERTRPRIDPVYGLDSSVVRAQSEVDVPGYRHTRPVHAGNSAGAQLQLGGFGDLLETVCLYTKHGHHLAPETGERLADAVDLLAAIWHREDAGLWELSKRAHYTTSKLGCWVAFERILQLAERGQAPSRHLSGWRRELARTREFIERELFDPARCTYLQRAGSSDLDCGTLLAARRGFGDPAGERMRGTIAAIADELDAGWPLLHRYSGMQGQENAFLACSFWMVEALALSGERDRAATMMDALVSLSNDVGLYSEEMTAGERALRGNFPQALTHLALVNAATALGVD